MELWVGFIGLPQRKHAPWTLNKPKGLMGQLYADGSWHKDICVGSSEGGFFSTCSEAVATAHRFGHIVTRIDCELTFPPEQALRIASVVDKISS